MHVAPDFFEHWKKSATSLGMTTSKVLHENFLLCNFDAKQSSVETAALFLCRFIFPVHHMWPVKVSSEDFIERASQGILKAFSATYFQNIQIFSPMVGLQSLCKNLRGRILQLAEPTLVKSSKGQFSNWRQDPFKAPTNAGTLYICITSNCVYAGVSTPRFSGSYYAGGRRFLKTSNEDSISRASAKIVEAIEHLDLIGCNSSGLMSWLELGASPGGMTRELLARDKNVVAVDRAHLSHELQNLPRLKFVQCDARQYSSHQTFDAILCDMNGDALTSAQTTSNLSKNLKSTGIIIFTLKIADAGELQYLLKHVLDSFENKNLKCFSIKHLFHNRQEVTLFFRK